MQLGMIGLGCIAPYSLTADKGWPGMVIITEEGVPCGMEAESRLKFMAARIAELSR